MSLYKPLVLLQKVLVPCSRNWFLDRKYWFSQTVYWFLEADIGFLVESTGFLAECWFGILLVFLRHSAEVVGHQFLTGDHRNVKYS